MTTCHYNSIITGIVAKLKVKYPMQKTLLTIGTILSTALPILAQNTVKEETIAKIENFKSQDPFGISMSIIAMGVVFIALIVLFLCFKWSGKLLNKGLRKQKTAKTATPGRSSIRVTHKTTGESADREIAAAIGMALFLAEDGMHDIESDELTLSPAEQAWTGRGNNQKQEPWRKF